MNIEDTKKTAKLLVELTRSPIGCKPIQRRTINALGLRRINHKILVDDNAGMRGMIQRVSHLVHVEKKII